MTRGGKRSQECKFSERRSNFSLSWKPDTQSRRVIVIVEKIWISLIEFFYFQLRVYNYVINNMSGFVEWDSSNRAAHVDFKRSLPNFRAKEK